MGGGGLEGDVMHCGRNCLKWAILGGKNESTCQIKGGVM